MNNMRGQRVMTCILAQRHLDASITFRLGGMLKNPPSVVLGSQESSTYPEGTPPVLAPPAALLDGLFEHPARVLSLCLSWIDCRGGSQ